MAATRVTYGDVMRRKYLRAMESAVFVGTPLLDFLEKQTPGEGDVNAGLTGGLKLAKVPLPTGGMGTGVQVDFHIGRNWGTGARAGHSSATTGYLPTPGQQAFTSGLLTPKNYWARGQIDGELIDATEGPMEGQEVTPEGLSALDRELRSLPPQLRADLNGDLYGDGTGTLAAVTSATGSGTAVIPLDSTRRLLPGQPIVVASNVGAGAVARTIVSVDSATQITVDSNTSFSATSRIYRAGIHNTNVSSEYGQAVSGLDLIISATSTYATINRTTAANAMLRSWLSPANALSTVDIVGLLEDATWEISKRNGVMNAVFCDQKFWKKFGQAYFGYQQWQSQIKILKGGYPVLYFHDCPLVRDPAINDWTAYPLDTTKFKLGVERRLRIVNRDGQEMVRCWGGDGTADEDAYRFGFNTRLELVCTNPGPQGKITINPLA